jgi:CyaY protein
MYLGRLVESGGQGRVVLATAPSVHAHAARCHPDIHMSGRARTPVQGEVPNPLNPPSGCSFHPRCPHANERCKIERPAQMKFGGALIACHAWKKDGSDESITRGRRRRDAGAAGCSRTSGPFCPQPTSDGRQHQRCTHCQRSLDEGRYTRTASLHHDARDSIDDHAMTDLEYHDRANAVLARVEAHVDTWLQDDVVDIDAQRTGGLLELSFPNGSKMVLNTQPPLHEIWLAARSGGYHYKFVDGAWLRSRGPRTVRRCCRAARASRPRSRCDSRSGERPSSV